MPDICNNSVGDVNRTVKINSSATATNLIEHIVHGFNGNVFILFSIA